MTEIESKIVQLLKSDEDCNKILGLMLGRNEFNDYELMLLILNQVIKRDPRESNKLFIGKYALINYYKELAIWICEENVPDKYHKYTDYIEVLPLFKEFLKLTIDDNRIQPTT